LFGLGIRHVGATVAKKLAKAFTSIHHLRAASTEDLLAVDEIGAVIANQLVAYFNDPVQLDILDRLIAYGLRFEIDQQVSPVASNVLNGAKMVVSGVFESFSRDELKDLIERNGGQNVGSISSKTTYVVAGAGMGPSKLKKAVDLGVPILSEEEFKNLIGI
jgi:DNA ligase (NAD+)